MDLDISLFCEGVPKKSPLRNILDNALPVLSGPSENKNVAGISCFFRSLQSAGTPSLVPRKVSTSTFIASFILLCKLFDFVIFAEQMEIERKFQRCS